MARVALADGVAHGKEAYTKEDDPEGVVLLGIGAGWDAASLASINTEEKGGGCGQ